MTVQIWRQKMVWG